MCQPCRNRPEVRHCPTCRYRHHIPDFLKWLIYISWLWHIWNSSVAPWSSIIWSWWRSQATNRGSCHPRGEDRCSGFFLFFVVSLSFCFLFVILNSQVFTEQDKVRGSGGSGGEYTTQPETSPDTSPVSSPGIFSLSSLIPNSNLFPTVYCRTSYYAPLRTKILWNAVYPGDWVERKKGGGLGKEMEF